MRVFTNGRGAQPSLVNAVGTTALHAWTFSQATAASNLTDVVEGGQTLTAAGSPGAGLAAPVETARSFDGSTQYFVGTGNGADALTLTYANEWSVAAWVKPDAGLTAQAYVVAYGANGSTLGTNHLLSLSVTTGYCVQAYWETATSAHVATTSTATIPAGQWSHLAFVYSVGTLALYINGALAQSWSGLAAPGCAASGNTQRWVVGAVADSLGSKFKGRICSVAVWAVSLSAADVLDAFRRGMGWHYGTTMHAMVTVQDGSASASDPSSFVDVSDIDGRDWLVAVELHDDADARGPSGSVRLVKEVGYASLGKLIDNKLNRTPLTGTGPGDTTYSAATEFIALDRRIRVHVVRVPWGVARPASASSEWQLVLDGVIDDVDWAGEDVVIQVQDVIVQRLTKGWLETVNTYSSSSGTAVETVMQSIITYATSSGWVPVDPNTGSAVALYTPVSPSWMIKEYEQSRMRVLEALAERADQIGWVVRRVWDDGTGAFRLTFFDADRARTLPLATFGAADYFDVGAMHLDMSRIRNAVRVQYWSTESDAPSSGMTASGFTNTAGGIDGTANDGNPTEHWVQWVNDASVAKYGRVFMEVAEAATSNIDRVNEADKMGWAMCADLCEPLVEQSVSMLLFPELGVGDLLRWKANQHHYTSDQDLAVTGWQLNLAGDRSGMDVRCRGKPCASPMRALSKDPRQGFLPAHTLRPEHVQAGLTISRSRNTAWHLVRNTGAIRSGRTTRLVNADLQGRIYGPSLPPDGWDMYAGAWATDAEFSTTTALAGVSSVRLPNATGKLAQWVPVQKGKTYQAEMTWSASASNAAQMVVYWFQADRVTPASTASSTVLNDTTGTTWITSRATVSAPTDARWARMVLQRSAGAASVWIDSVGWALAMPGFRAYRASTGQALTEGGYTKVAFNAEDYDYRGSHSSGTFTAPEAGMYRFQAQVTAQSDTAAQRLSLQATIYKNGSKLFEASPQTSVTAITYACTATIDTGDVILAAGDTVEVYVFAKEEKAMASTIKAGAGLTWFSGRLIPNE